MCLGNAFPRKTSVKYFVVLILYVKEILHPSCVPKLILPAVYVNLDHLFCFHCVFPIGSSLEGRQ